MSSFPPDPTMPGPVPPGPGGPSPTGPGLEGPPLGPPTMPGPTIGFGAPPPGGPPPGGPPFGGPPPGGPPRSGPNPALLVGIVVLVVGLIAAGAFVLLSGDDDKEGEDSEEVAQGGDQSENRSEPSCVGLSAPDQDDDGLSAPDQEGDDLSVPDQEGDSEGSGSGSSSGDEGSGSGSAGSEGSEDGCTPPADSTEIEVPEVDVPEEVEVDPPADEGDTGDDTGTASSDDVTMTFAEEIYSNTPGGVGEQDAVCLATAVIAVVGEDAVVDSGYSPSTLYGQTSFDEDDQISSNAYSCTTVEADSALASGCGWWPCSWVPAP
jgi:hypothetical protein